MPRESRERCREPCEWSAWSFWKMVYNSGNNSNTVLHIHSTPVPYTHHHTVSLNLNTHTSFPPSSPSPPPPLLTLLPFLLTLLILLLLLQLRKQLLLKVGRERAQYSALAPPSPAFLLEWSSRCQTCPNPSSSDPPVRASASSDRASRCLQTTPHA